MRDWIFITVEVKPYAGLLAKTGAILFVVFQLVALIFVLSLAARLAWSI